MQETGERRKKKSSLLVERGKKGSWEETRQEGWGPVSLVSERENVRMRLCDRQTGI